MSYLSLPLAIIPAFWVDLSPKNVGQCGVVGFSVRGAPLSVVDASGFQLDRCRH